MKKLRSRFGSRLVPAKELLADIIKRRGVVRAVAMVADQEPTTSEHKHWTRFLNRDTAFYMGPEEIARATRFPVFFIGLRRTARGYYEMQLTALSTPRRGDLPPARSPSATRAWSRRRSTPPRPDWPWSHKRWKLKKSLYQRRARARAPEASPPRRMTGPRGNPRRAGRGGLHPCSGGSARCRPLSRTPASFVCMA